MSSYKLLKAKKAGSFKCSWHQCQVAELEHFCCLYSNEKEDIYSVFIQSWKFWREKFLLQVHSKTLTITITSASS